jgi:CDP-diacylglycerol--glycerol-3-phosphate 3-phosphatidyltransferase
MLKGTILETHYYGLLERYVIPLLIYLKLKPSHVSILGLLASMIAGISFVYNHFWGGVMTLLTGFLDTLDGCLARSLGQNKSSGAFLDSVLDRYTELIIYLGIWGYFYRLNTMTPFLSLMILLILFGSLMVSYARARAEGIGEHCIVGPFQRGERIILIGLAGIFNPLVNGLLDTPHNHWSQDMVLVIVLLVLAVGTNLTALWRFLYVMNNLRRQEGYRK